MEMIVGIDFGTTGSRVACVIDGRPVVLENGEGEGTTLSYVAVPAGGPPVVGEAARRLAPNLPGDVVYAVKRLIGRSYGDPAIQALKQTVSYEIVPGENESAWVRIGGADYAPIEIAKVIFADLLNTVHRALGDNVRKAVVAVPAYYGYRQRQLVKSAAEAAGFQILRIIPEPTAAALIHEVPEGSQKIAVYDFGGGTFDLSIVDIGDGIFEVLATGGDLFLGGEDIDLRLQAYLLERAGLDRAGLSAGSLQRLKTAAEEAKKELSGRDRTRVVLPSLSATGGWAANLDVEVARETLQELSQDLVDRTLAISSRIMDLGAVRWDRTQGIYRSPITREQIDQVVLVGGTTRLPFVEDCVERFFGRKARPGARREDAVVLGCAIQAGIMAGATKDSILLDILPWELGIELNGQAWSVLWKGETIPARRDIEIQGDDCGNRILHIFEGAADRVIGAIDISPLAEKEGRYQLKVQLDVDANSWLKVDVVGDEGRSVSKIFQHDAEAVFETAFEGARLATPARDAPLLRILAIGTEWGSGKGGLSTLNRQLCQALAAEGHSVVCLVLDLSQHDIAAASAVGVKLVQATSTPGQSESAALCRKPKLPPGWRPDIVIGHGRVTGSAAVAQVEDHFTSAKRVHVIHVAPDEIEWHKLDRADDAGERAYTRTMVEVELGSNAARAIAVGPLLYNRYLTDFHAGADENLKRLDPGFDAGETPFLGAPRGKPWRVLVVARAEDENLKGLDIAARSVALANRRRPAGAPPLELVVKGAQAGTSEALYSTLTRQAGADLKIKVQPFDSAGDRLSAEYRKASLVLMPSRSEGFGLVGLEALVAGVPVLVSSESGLGELLMEELPAERAGQLVVSTSGDSGAIDELWAKAIERVLHDRDNAFRQAEALRADMGARKPWAAMVKGLFDGLV